MCISSPSDLVELCRKLLQHCLSLARKIAVTLKAIIELNTRVRYAGGGGGGGKYNWVSQHGIVTSEPTNAIQLFHLKYVYLGFDKRNGRK
jgi:hypothetical protein